MSDIDTSSATWRAVVEYAEAELRAKRAQLETPGLSPDVTENLRGAIMALAYLYVLPLAKAGPPADALKTDDLPGIGY